MRLLILVILLIIASIQQSEAKDLSVDAMAGYAFHPQKYNNYNDNTFNDNRTSDVALLSLNYNSFSLIGLSDSQGEFSFASVFKINAHKTNSFNLDFITGIYFLNTENHPNIFEAHISNMLPKISLLDNEFTVLPLIGISIDYKVTSKVSLNTTLTPTFLLVGLKLRIGK